MTYEINGHIHANFDDAAVSRHAMFDKVGKDNAKKFLELGGWVVSANDINKQTQGIIVKNADLIATNGNQIICVEAAVKRPSLWKHIRPGNVDNGADVETRKLKYLEQGLNGFVFMSDCENFTQMLMIPMICLEMAQESCGDQYVGHGRVRISDGWKGMPKHGCHRVRKPCDEGYGQRGTIEDFYRIPYEYLTHWKYINGVLRIVSRPTLFRERNHGIISKAS